MKKILACALVCLSLASCSTLLRSEYRSIDFLDFRPYSASGFFISPEAYSGKSGYLPIGTLDIVISPEWERQVTEVSVGGLASKEYSREELLNIAVTEAKKRGANGMVDFKIDVKWTGDRERYVDYYHVTAFLILIEEL